MISVRGKAFHAQNKAPERPGWRTVRDRMLEQDGDPKKRQLLASARKRLARVLADRGTLKALRLERGLSRRELAELCSIPESVLARIEAGASDPRLSVCRKVAAALDVSLDVLAAAVGPRAPSSKDVLPGSESDG